MRLADRTTIRPLRGRPPIRRPHRSPVQPATALADVQTLDRGHSWGGASERHDRHGMHVQCQTPHEDLSQGTRFGSLPPPRLSPRLPAASHSFIRPSRADWTESNAIDSLLSLASCSAVTRAARSTHGCSLFWPLPLPSLSVRIPSLTPLSHTRLPDPLGFDTNRLLIAIRLIRPFLSSLRACPCDWPFVRRDERDEGDSQDQRARVGAQHQ